MRDRARLRQRQLCVYEHLMHWLLPRQRLSAGQRPSSVRLGWRSLRGLPRRSNLHHWKLQWVQRRLVRQRLLLGGNVQTTLTRGLRPQRRCLHHLRPGARRHLQLERPVRLWHRRSVCVGAAVFGWRLCVRLDVLPDRVLHGLDVQPDSDLGLVWPRRRHLCDVRFAAGRSLQRQRPMCLRRGRGVRGGSTLPRQHLRVRFDLVPNRLLQREQGVHDAISVNVRHGRGQLRGLRFDQGRLVQRQRSVFMRQWRCVQPRSTLLGWHLCLRLDLVPERLLYRGQDVCLTADGGKLRHQRRRVHGV